MDLMMLQMYLSIQRIQREKRIVKKLDGDAVADVRIDLSFDDSEIGSCMTTNFVCISNNLTIRQAMSELVKQAGENDNITTIYVMDENKKIFWSNRFKGFNYCQRI